MLVDSATESGLLKLGPESLIKGHGAGLGWLPDSKPAGCHTQRHRLHGPGSSACSESCAPAHAEVVFECWLWAMGPQHGCQRSRCCPRAAGTTTTHACIWASKQSAAVGVIIATACSAQHLTPCSPSHSPPTACAHLDCVGSLDLADLDTVLRERLLVDPSAVDTFVCGLQAFLDDAGKVGALGLFGLRSSACVRPCHQAWPTMLLRLWQSIMPAMDTPAVEKYHLQA